MRALPKSILVAALSLTATCASAQLYKWVDESGVVNYGDSPPSGVRIQPVTQGTVSSVAVPRQQVEASAPRDASRRTQRAPREVNETMNVSVNTGSTGSSDDPDYIAGYAPYYPYPRREIARAEAIGRPRVEQPIAKPILPVDPAVPDMPLRPRR